MSTRRPDPAPPAPAAELADLAGRSLGKYELVRLLARGGMGEVYLARLSGELGFVKRLVVKTIRPELAADPRFVELFAAEAKTAVALNHPNITPIYELGRAADGTLFTAMGWVDGPSLAALGQALRRRGLTLELGAALFITRELLDGLAHAHQPDRERPAVVHRDVTPRNVLVDRSGRVQIVDFGIAKPAAAEATGQMGSRGYMPPEQARGEPVDPRADVFAVGCVLYELLTGARAFAGDGVWQRPDLGGVAEPVRPLLERALDLDPSRRFADADVFLRALAPVLATVAPSYASRDLAAWIADLDLDPELDAAGEQGSGSDRAATPATAAPAPVVTFATRIGPAAPPVPAPTPDPAPAPAPAPARRTGSSPRGWLALLVISVVIALAIGVSRSPAFGPSGASRDRPEPIAEVPDQPAAPTPIAEPTPRPAPRPEPVADPPPRTRALIVDPADAQVELDGERLDGPPYALPARDEPVELRITHPDHRTWAATLEPDGALLADPLRVTLDPLAHGSLSVVAPSVAWAEVWVDGVELGTTPLADKPLVEGKHRVEVRCPAAVCGSAQLLLARTIRVRPGRSVELDAGTP